MKFGVVQFPGSNSDQDCVNAVEVLGHEAVFLWHKESSVHGVDAVLVPGGFSYGDYLRPGAIARFSPVMRAVKEFAARGGWVLGICNGFQILCEAGLLPGALIRNRELQFRCEPVFLETVHTETPFTSRIQPGQILRMPIAHGEGCFFVDEPRRRSLVENGQVLWRYCDWKGSVEPASNPNGSVGNIAGVCNQARTVAGLMPHPERACEETIGGTDGRWILEGMIQSWRARAEPALK